MARLVIITDDGQIVPVTEDIEQYDLNIRVALSSVVDDLKSVINKSILAPQDPD